MKRVILLSVSILLISSGFAFAEVPCKINYQGRLIKDNVPVDGTKTMTFSIYNSDAGGTLRWTSGDVSVEVHNGLFRHVLDLSTIDWAAGETLYLEVQVGTDILTPREAIYAYPYSINSHLLEGETKDYFLDTSGNTQTKQGGLNIMGNVGIGTTPGEDLEVNGDIKVDETVYFDAEYNNGNSGTADTIDWRVANKQKSTLTGNVTFTFIAPGGPCNLVLKLVQDTIGSRTVTWPATVKWAVGTKPTLTAAPNAIDIVSFYYDGTNYYGQASLNFQ